MREALNRRRSRRILAEGLAALRGERRISDRAFPYDSGRADGKRPAAKTGRGRPQAA